MTQNITFSLLLKLLHPTGAHLLFIIANYRQIASTNKKKFYISQALRVSANGRARCIHVYNVPDIGWYCCSTARDNR